MKRMTINEAIEHCNEKTDCSECGQQHMQLAEWLNKLQEYKDAEEQGLLLRLPCKIVDVVDVLFSHNEILALWVATKEEPKGYLLVWSGMAWNIPENLKSYAFVKIFGCIPDNIMKADNINIEVRN